MAVTTTQTNKPLNPRGNDQSPKGYNRAELYSGKALDFDGVNDYVDIGSFSMSGNNATFVFNYNQDAAASAKFVFDNEGARLSIGQGDVSGSFGVDTGSIAWEYFGSLESNKWYGIVVIIEGSTAKCYANGAPFGDAVDIGETINFANVTNATIGARYSKTASNFDGELSGFKIFNTALTAAQVADLYNNPEKVVPTGVDNTALKLWLPMQEGAGTTAYDGSGNGNHGTISGATWTHGIGAPVSQTAVIDWNKGTNYLEYSNNFTHASWLKLAAGGGSIPTITADYTTGPSGENDASRLQASNTGGGGGDYSIIQVGISTSATDAVAGVWVKSNTGSNQTIYFRVDGADSDSTAVVTTEWTRINKTGSLSTTMYNTIGLRGPATGTSSIDISIWGASLEKAASVGPYVYTNGTAQTSPVLLPQGLTTGRDITGVNLFENVRKQGALNLDGNSWAEVHDNASLDLTSALTMEAWVYSSASDATAGDGVLSKWHEGSNERSYLIYALDFDSFYFFVSNDGTASNSVTFGINSADYEKYNHFVCTFDGTNLKAYVNGALYNTSAATFSSIYNSDKNVAIGNYNIGQTPERKYDNSIAQPRIYNRALTAEEVERNYNAGKNIYK